MFNENIKVSCTAKAVFAALRTQVVDCAARMNRQGPGRFLPSDDESFDLDTRRFEIRRETWDGTVQARLRFEVGSGSITVMHVEADGSRCIAVQMIPAWDNETRTCRLGLYDDDGAFSSLVDPGLEVISQLALEWFRRKGSG